ncbi:N-acetylmuramoyl-L-alanine amidase [Wenzhouxiangella sp. XN201]|nr:N-acetylmuramoyl-L-alanine amidase [Wenzhouxiangella sp. XN201]
MNQYLIEYLTRAGAYVFPVRERDLQTAMVIVDDGDLDDVPSNGLYAESGDLSLFTGSGLGGFDNFQAPYSPTTNPFEAPEGTSRLLTTAASETARATWTPVLPQSGHYEVYVSYLSDGSRASDVHYVVTHSGGEAHVRIDQQRHGSTWISLGRYHFEAWFDSDVSDRASVALLNDSTEPGSNVSLDAVRFGGGMGDVVGQNFFEVSGEPRWEEAARTYVQFMGAPSSVYDFSPVNDVTPRSRYAAWQNQDGEDAVYVSIRSHGYEGARGTESFVYSANPPDGSTYDPTQSSPGSVELMTAIHNEVIADLRSGWDSTWADRGISSAYFGELNPANNDEMPSSMIYLGFHGNVQDAEAMSDPRFRRLVARSIYQGIVKYFANRDGAPFVLLPEPPEALSARGLPDGTIRVDWSSSPTDDLDLLGDPATSYRVHISDDGQGFRLAGETSGNQFDLTPPEPGEIVYLRLTAVNAGGESLPTEVLSVRSAHAADAKILLVQGFDRLERSLMPLEDMNYAALGMVFRMDLDRMNRGDYLLQYAEALKTWNVSFDSSSNEAVTNGRVGLDPETYNAIFWSLGRESTADETFDTTEQTFVTSYLNEGGSFFASGSNLGWDLDFKGSAADRAFFEDVLGANYVADDAGVYEIFGAPGTRFHALELTFDDGSHGIYDVRYPDVLSPALDGAQICLSYPLDIGDACVQYDAGDYRVLTLGVPFESIVSGTKRADLMERILLTLRVVDKPIFQDRFEDGALISP